MPVHDWSKVTAGTFHDFHQAWITALGVALNDGLLPEVYYAMAEQVAGRPHSGVLALDEFEPSADWPGAEGGSDAGVALAIHPPKVRYTLEAEESLYAAKANRIAIYHTSGDRVVAFIEIVSPGNKRSQVAVNQLVEKLAAALQQGRHLLVIDLHPAGKHDPDGLHAAFWGTTPGVTKDHPLSLAAYRADVSPTAYFEPIGIGVALPDMPLFLTPDHYVNVPLEATYQTAWRGVPKRWKRVIEEQN
ncbi:MAG: DUF4058 family protein [Planctomycetes bacterium]|nr:DUF4058 family protein [Planctomycetota bacterium]